MQTIPGTTPIAARANQTSIERAPFSIPALIICVIAVIAVAVVNVVNTTNIETGAHAPVSFCANLLLASLLTSLTLTGLARLAGLHSLVGLTTTKLATSTA